MNKLERILFGKASAFFLFFLLTVPPASTAGGTGTPEKVKVVKTTPSYASQLEVLDHVVITIEFNREMDPTIAEDAVMDQRGASDADGNAIEIKGHVEWPARRILQFKVEAPLKPLSTYQLSLFSARTLQGEEMEEVPYRLVFTTGTEK